MITSEFSIQGVLTTSDGNFITSDANVLDLNLTDSIQADDKPIWIDGNIMIKELVGDAWYECGVLATGAFGCTAS